MNKPGFLATFSVCGLIIGAPHFLGGATAATSWFIAATACLAFAAVWVHARELERKRFVVPALGVAIALHAATLLQGLPLPCGIVGIFARQAVANQREASGLLGSQAFQFCTQSYDVGGTWNALAWTSTVIVTLLSCSLFVQLGGRRSLLVSVAVSCALVAASTLTHRLGSLTTLYGMYQPVYSHTRNVGPFLNENHLAAFVSFGVPTMIALGLERTDSAYNTVWFGAAALATGTAVLTLSRGAFAMLLFELSLFVFLAAFRKRGKNMRPQLRMLALACVSCLALGLYVAGDSLLSEFESTDSSKLTMIRSAFGFSFSEPLVGVGRGAFGSAFTAVFGTTSRAQFAENLLAQWGTEWGWPLALAAIGVLTWWLLLALLNAKTMLQAAGVISLAALGLQNMVDFNLELPGFVVVGIALFVATVIPARNQAMPALWRSELLARPSSMQICLASGFFALAGTVVAIWSGATDPSFEDLYRSVLSRTGTVELLDEIKKGVKRHPSDARFALLAASVANSVDARDADGWVRFAERLAPGWSGPHLVDAHRLLLAGNADKAVESLRMAIERDPTGIPDLACDMAKIWTAEGGGVERLLPEGPTAANLADKLADCARLDPASKAAVDRLIVKRLPDNWSARLRLARLPSTPPQEAVALLTPLVDKRHPSALVYAVLANAYESLGRSKDAMQVLARCLEYSSEPYLGHAFLAERHGRARNIRAMRDELDAMRAEAGEHPRVLPDAFARQGDMEATYGDPRLGMQAYEKAYRLAPRKDLLLALMNIATQLGDHVKLKWVRATLCRDGDATYCSPTTGALSGAEP